MNKSCDYPFLDFLTYTEISPSRCGLKLLFYTAREDVRPFLDQIDVRADQWGCRRSVPGANAANHGPAVEVYFAGRFFAVTGERWPHSPDKITLLDQEALDALARLIPPARRTASSPPTKGGAARAAATPRAAASRYAALLSCSAKARPSMKW